MLTICAVFAAAFAWSFFGRLDVNAVAPGKLEPTGRVKVIQSLDPGKVAAIRVENGQPVKAGDLLLEFDPAEAAADERAAREALQAGLGEIARRRAAIDAARAAQRASGRERRAAAGARSARRRSAGQDRLGRAAAGERAERAKKRCCRPT